MFLCSAVVESLSLMEMSTNTKHASSLKSYILAKTRQSCARLSTFFSVDRVNFQVEAANILKFSDIYG